MLDICNDNQSSILFFNSSIQDVPECYQDSIIIWIPTCFLFFIAPFYIYSLEADKNIGHTWLNILKTFLSAFLALLCLGDTVVSFYEYSNGFAESRLHILAPCVLFLAMIVTLLLIQLGRCRGAYISGFLFIFWLLLFLADVILFQSRVRVLVIESNKRNTIEVYHMVYSLISLIGTFIQSVLAGFFVDGKQPNATKEANNELKDCPEDTACFLSRITFWWFTPLVITGYKKSLERSDLWNLWYKNQTKNVMPKFEEHWERELAKHFNSLQNRVYMDVALTNSSNAEMKVLLDPQKTPIDPMLIKKTKAYKPSLWKALARSFGMTFLYGAFFKLIHDILMFASPLILKYIIKFINDPTAPDWIGYIYASLIFLVAFIQSMMLHQYFHVCMVVGMNVRTALVGTIYKKSLRLSNESRKKSTVGEIVNLMSTDAQRFMELTTYLNMLWSAPFQMCLSLYFLWNVLGPSVLAGVGVMILLIPINILIAKKSKALQTIQMKHKDARIKLMSEIFNGIKVLKLYAWEPSFKKKVLDIRNKELDVLKKASYLGAVSSFVWNCSPFLVSLATFAVYVLSSSENILDAEKAFVSLALFNILRFPLSMLPMLIASMVQTSVSVKRLEDFLISEDLDMNSVQRISEINDPAAVIIDNGIFSWEKSRENGVTLEAIALRVEKGKLIGIVGSVGSGKSSLISAILGETEKLNGTVIINGSVAYVSQQAWMQNASVENNILFGKPMDRKFYEKVIDACALRPDLELLAAGDETEIGEKGINLSGGQKQRISLARAVYMDADIYLLDDTLSAVDAHVGRHIFNQVIGANGLLKNKTRIFVTHGISHLKYFDEILVMVGGRITELGTYSQLLRRQGSFAEFLRTHLLKEDDQAADVEDDEELELKKKKVPTATLR